jgi:hypothetical protein
MCVSGLEMKTGITKAVIVKIEEFVWLSKARAEY